MKTKLIALGSALFAAACCGPLAAQTVYRCGDAYSQQPCAGAKVVPAGEALASAQAAQERRAATQREAKLADAMEKSRLKEEAKPVQAYIPPARPAAAAAAEERKYAMVKPEKAHYFTAVSPGNPGEAKKTKKAKKKAD